MTENEIIPKAFCIGKYFPIACQKYGDDNVVQELQYSSNAARQISPVFLSDADHSNLLRGLSTQPLTFTRARIWVMPLKYASIIPLRLDSNVYFYDRASSERYDIYESYAIKGGIPKTSLLFSWPEEELNNPKPMKPMNLLERRTNLDGAILNHAWHSGSLKHWPVFDCDRTSWQFLFDEYGIPDIWV